MPLVGELALALGLIVACYSIVANVLGVRRGIPSLLLSAWYARAKRSRASADLSTFSHSAYPSSLTSSFR
jgi:hypothetical protein